MEYRNLISPEFKVEIGAYVLEDGIEVEISAVKKPMQTGAGFISQKN